MGSACRSADLFRSAGAERGLVGIFFGSRLPGVAFAEIVILWLAIVFNTVLFYWLVQSAALLLIPYILWVTYAAYLNFGIWWLNRRPTRPA